ncbi:MAG: hypothetical protein OEO23_15090 [Gemmatimonadota bacterium]|nr:hypothetical protein [Gemmatimonadota bacterium]
MTKRLLTSTLSLALLFSGACDQSPTEPVASTPSQAIHVPAPSFQLSTTDGLTALRWSEPTEKDQWAASGINEKGGSLSVNPGIHLLIPSGALEEKTEITVISRAGEDVAFEFGPHGLQFRRMVTVRIELDELENRDEIRAAAKRVLSDSNSDRVLLGEMTAIYYENQDGELVETLETFPVYLVDGKYIEFYTNHFSGYALAA